ncbi:LacI family DNA-binding transcriptional regulator [Curtobacterium sp. ISL-83]|uniref:LacI family DNA-binding transcriptional regulator n=1 Tax=Curtobacterium sp. ISL-83 TaxID=2819145 RepID=UPI001BE5B634|nr:LacI family DNA-binding transcriptional regulator [Curtobacterium sp. ISL-83]MBT2502113.1 LacI family DNA-binding transcriptional regulator [Curtobacterium sp. ISL-83]
MAQGHRSPPTMSDVAALAGVSKKTVSNVLSGYEHVSARTHDRVMAAVDELGYELNVSARNFRAGRSRVLGLAVPELRQAYFAELADAVIRAAGAVGYTVLIEQTASGERESDAITRMREHSIDGIIYSPLAVRESDVEALEVKFPLVVLGEPLAGSGATFITMSNAAAVRDATEHLLSAGRTAIAFLGAEPDGPVRTALERLRGYREALAAHGIPLVSERIVSTALWHRADGAEAARRLLAAGVTVDGIVCCNDALALGAMSALQLAGRDVPGDVAVVGFDDIEESAYATPALTTVSADLDRVAATAVGLLVAQLEEGAAPSPGIVESPHALLVRASSGAVVVPSAS